MPCPSDLMSASLASFNTELGVAEFWRVVSQLHRPIDPSLWGHSWQMLNMCAHVCFCMCSHLWTSQTFKTNSYKIRDSYKVATVMKLSWKTHWLLRTENMSQLSPRYFYIQDCFLMILSEIRNKFLQKNFHPYVINTSENSETTQRSKIEMIKSTNSRHMMKNITVIKILFRESW